MILGNIFYILKEKKEDDKSSKFCVLNFAPELVFKASCSRKKFASLLWISSTPNLRKNLATFSPFLKLSLKAIL